MRKVIASYVISNTASMNIYEVNHGIDDSVIAGINNDEPQEYTLFHDVDDETGDIRSYFDYHGTYYYIDEFMTV